MSPDARNDAGKDPIVPLDAQGAPSPARSKNPLSRDVVVRAYRRYAPVYDRIFGGVLNPGRRALAEAVTALQPASLLEVGVGTGLMLSLIHI